MSDRVYTHQALISADAPPRPACGGSGRCVVRTTDVDCPDCLQLDADRKSRTEVRDVQAVTEADGPDVEPLMTSREVADMFRVDVRIPVRWANAGLITCIRTPGRHLRFVRAEIESYFNVRTTEFEAYDETPTLKGM